MKTKLHKPWLWRLGVATLAATTSVAVAQSTSPNDSSDVVELNPFVVDSSQDQGYNASNTTSATRLNEQIKDLPMNIQALTGDFLDDIASTDILESLAYVAGVEPTEDANDREINFRGINSRFARRNQFVWYNPTDNYSTERIEVVRGPNSLLYGQAEPGGLINTITKKPIFGRNFYNLQARVSDYGSVRGTLDLNFGDILGNGKAGLRIAGMNEDRDSWKDPFDYSKQGIYLSGAIRPVENLEIRVEFEDGEIDEGKRLQSMETFNGKRLPEAVDNSGNPLLGTLVPRERARTLSGLDDQRVRDYENIAVYVEGTFFDDQLSIQYAFNEQQQSQNGHQIQGTNTIRFGNFTDTVSGQSFTDTYYVRAQRQRFTNGNTVTNHRLTASYEFELGGSIQNLVVGLDNRVDEFYLLNIQERGGAPDARNGPRKAWNINIQNGAKWSLGVPLEEAAAGFTFKPQFGIENEETVDALFVALSGKYFDERLHLVTGWRRDDFSKLNTPNPHLDAYPGFSSGTPVIVEDDEVDSYNAGFTYGLNERVNLYANYSESFKAAGAFRLDPDRNQLTSAIGKGSEFGFKFDTADRKYSGTISYYEMQFDGDQVNIGGNSVTRNSIDPNSPLNGRHGGNFLSLDTEANGAEIQLVANPSDNLRFQFSYGYIIDSSVAQDFAIQANFNDSFLVGADGNPVDTSGNPIPLGGGFVTLNDIVWSADGQVATNARALNLEGNGESGLKTNPYTGQTMPDRVIRGAGDKNDPWSRHNLNFLTKYTWTDGALKGFSLGGSMRGRYDNFAGGGTTNPDYTVFDLILGYTKKFEKFGWSSQINVLNVTDKDYFLGRQYTRWGNEREIVWTNTFRF
ncbi:MAG: hypothetical protein SynsKO_38460 [Synoicihabitans sp.]